MRITVKAHPKSKKNALKKISENSYEIWFNAAPIEGKANQEILKVLSKELKIPKTSIKLVSGLKSKIKIFEI